MQRAHRQARRSRERVANGIPEEVNRLVADHIVSVEQLETLLMLRREPEREWSAESVKDELRTSILSASERLDDLTRRGFLAVRESADGRRYRYEPASAADRRSVEQLARAYSERRYTIIEMIFAKPIERLRVFADAFRLRKEDPGE